MNAHDIALALAPGPFPYRRYVCVPNLSWGLLPHEADFAAIAPSGFLYEVEIKISVADLRRDAAKAKFRRWHEQSLIRGFLYAMPRAVWEKVEADPPIPDFAGVVVVNHLARVCNQTTTIRSPRLNNNARRLSDREQRELGRLGTMRYWTRMLPEEKRALADADADADANTLPLGLEVA